MREINIKLTEKLLQDYTGYTVEQLADANGYQTKVMNPDYVPAIGNETMPNPQYVPGESTIDENGALVEVSPAIGEPEILNPEYVPAVGEPVIDNPKTRTQHLADVAVAALVKAIAEPLRRETIAGAQRQAEAGFSQALQMVIDGAEVKVIE